MAYTRPTNRRQIHPPGSTPEAECREVKAGSSITLEIGDPRTLLKSAKLQNAGFKCDPKDLSIWTTTDRAAYEDMKREISATPYFVIDPHKARYAKDELRNAGFKTYALKMPFLNNTGESKDWYFVCRNKEEYNKAEQIANAAFKIKPEQVAEIQKAVASGSLNDAITKRVLATTDNETKRTIEGPDLEGTLAMAEDGHLTQSDFGKLMRAVTPANQEQIDRLKELAAEGRLTEINAKRPLDDASLANVTQEAFYELDNLGRKMATSKQRAQLHYLMDRVRDGHTRRDEQALRDHTITHRDAKNLIDSKLVYVPEERAQIESLDGNAKIETSAERKVRMLDQLNEIAGTLGAAQPFAFTKRDGYTIAAANAGGLVLRDRNGALHVASSQAVWMPDELANTAARTEGAEGALIGSVVVVKGARSAVGKPQIHPSTEHSIGGALALDDARAEAKGMGLGDVPVVQPKAGQKLTVWGVSDTHVAGVTSAQELVVVPSEQVAGKNGRPLFNEVVEVLGTDAAAPKAKNRAAAGASR